MILAAVIAAFVFGMTGNMQTQKNVAITGGINSTGHAVFTVQGGADLGSVNYINYMVDNNEIGKIFENATVGQENGTGEAVNGKHVKLIGYFNDGSQQILFDRQF
ncbi:MAG: type IV pilin N-terminal domain-containing protein [Methanofollis sp.]|nr:type IV pilin N-terminal domain-containing protein [Methanofollis sp.]